MSSRAPLIACALTLAAAGLTWVLIGPDLIALTSPSDGFDVDQLVLLYSSLPRAVTAILCGAALALAGAILQQVMRNPLASPTTLGLSSGAHLALAIATLFAPGLLGFGRDVVALCGSLAAALVVLGLASRRGFSPFALVLAGLIVSLYCGAVASLLILLNEQYLASLFIWGAGSLAQQDWTIALSLLPRLAVLCGLAALLIRPLQSMELGDAGVRALGFSPGVIRICGLTIALALSAIVASAVGVIGFIGLIAPTVARLAGARRLGSRLVWSTLIGGALLWLTDALVQLLAGAAQDFVPTGAVTALFGSPLLLLLLPRLRTMAAADFQAVPAPVLKSRPAVRTLVLLALGVAGLAVIALLAGRTPDGRWAWTGIEEWAAILPWRTPRIVVALAAGAILAVAGTLLQRLTGNEMASPEVLGVSAGAVFGLIVALFVFSAPDWGQRATFAALGTVAVLVAVLLFGGRSGGLVPERVVLAGIALGALLDAVVGALSAAGDPRAFLLLHWMSGSTYGVDWNTTAITLALGSVLVLAALMSRRWLDILPLGAGATTALGLSIARVRVVIYGLAAGLTALGTLVIGPLSFVGLMAPHIARELGLRRAAPQIIGSALSGGALVVIADWVGRMAAFPYQMPAGLISATVGAPFLLLLLGRRRSRNADS